MNPNNPCTQVISIIIPNWNGAKHIVTCLESIFASTYSELEVIVVDNGSTDKSIELITNNFPLVKILKFQTNKGFSAAVNAGIKNSSGSYIFLLNNDMRLEPHCIERLYTSLCLNTDCSMATGKIKRFDRTHYIDSAGDAITFSCAPFNRGHMQKDVGQFDKEQHVFGGCAGATLYHRKLFEEIGNFDEDFFAYMEDVDFNCRSLLTTHRALYVPNAIAYHHGNATFGTHSFFHVFYTNRNTLFVLFKNFRLKWIFLELKNILKHQTKMAHLFSTTDQGFSFFLSRLSAFAKIPRILIKRHRFMIMHYPNWDLLFSFIEKDTTLT
ncbi:glycosyltransferase family 2 protein [bacterium]|nr:glycosyltransferase family 2 protein [bacterium]MCP5462076.1 glycosyltransferase family 2 protein [bacterium]